MKSVSYTHLYFFYSLYIIWSENWYYPLKTEFLERRQQILSKIGLKIDFKMLKESENFLFLKTIKRYIDLRKPVILYLHGASIIYDQVYGDIAYDSIHGIMVTGYNMDHPTICLRDAAHIENSGAKYEGSGYGLSLIHIFAGIFGRVFIVRNSVPVKITLFSNFGSTNGLMSRCV